MGKNVLKTIATGDMFITRRIAKDGYEGFEEVRDCIMEHDVKFSNLEMTFHDQEGYPAAESGGTWAMMEPEEGKYDFEWLDRAVSPVTGHNH